MVRLASLSVAASVFAVAGVLADDSQLTVLAPGGPDFWWSAFFCFFSLLSLGNGIGLM